MLMYICISIIKSIFQCLKDKDQLDREWKAKLLHIIELLPRNKNSVHCNLVTIFFVTSCKSQDLRLNAKVDRMIAELFGN